MIFSLKNLFRTNKEIGNIVKYSHKTAKINPDMIESYFIDKINKLKIQLENLKIKNEVDELILQGDGYGNFWVSNNDILDTKITIDIEKLAGNNYYTTQSIYTEKMLFGRLAKKEIRFDINKMQELIDSHKRFYGEKLEEYKKEKDNILDKLNAIKEEYEYFKEKYIY